MKCRTSPGQQRRGTAAIVVVVLLVILNIVVLGMVLGGSRHEDLTIDRVQSVQAFYAAEGGMNMAVRDFAQNLDEDGDGVIGSISDDGDDGTDPMLGAGRVVAARADAPPQTTITSAGRAGNARREVELIAE